MSISVWIGLGLRDPKSYVQDFLKDVRGQKDDPQRSRKLPDPMVLGVKDGYDCPRKKQEDIAP